MTSSVAADGIESTGDGHLQVRAGRTARLARLPSARASVVCPAILIVFYLVVYGALLVHTRGLPYVYDNNESFSVYWHAQNLYRFSFWESAGVTDESYAQHAEGHPFVHTHQGNFPRLFGFLIYALGARTVESQIVITALTVGLLAVLTTYSFLANLTRPQFALLACVVLLTDYLGYAQWHVVSYRVWHMMLFFGALYCVQQSARTRQRRWLVLMCAVYLSLFYYELVFAAFSAMTAGLYAGWVHRRSLKLLIVNWSVQVGSAVASLGILLTQLTVLLGWDVVVEDLSITFLARNSLEDTAQQMERLQRFYFTHNIASFYNIIDVTAARTVPEFLRLHGEKHFQPYTPFLILLVMVVVGGWLAGLLVSRQSAKSHDSQSEVRSTGSAMATALLGVLAVLAVAVLGAAAGYFAITVLRDDAVFGRPLAGGSFLARASGPAMILAGVFPIASAWLAIRFGLIGGRFGVGASVRTLLAAGLLVGLAVFARSQSPYYDQRFAPIWFDTLGIWPAPWLGRLALLMAALVAVTCILKSTSGLLGRGRSLEGLVPYLVTCAIGYVVAYLLSPGYVYSGYVGRGASPLVFWTDIWVAIALWVPLIVGFRAVRDWWLGTVEPVPSETHPAAGSSLTASIGRTSTVDLLVRRLVSASDVSLRIGSIGLLLFAVTFWIHSQVVYLHLVPPTHLSYITRLGEPPYRGASFAVSTYAAPVAAFTDEWAYLSPTMAGRDLIRGKDGFTQGTEPPLFLWFADRYTNSAYARPDYYLCAHHQNQGPRLALARLLGRPYDGGCSDNHLIKSVQSGTNRYLTHRIVEEDPSPLHTWAIVHMDWDFPPYLQALGGADDPRVAASFANDGGRRVVNVEYRFAQENGQPEQGSVVRLVRPVVSGTSSWSQCVVAEQIGGHQLMLPAEIGGTYYFVTVTPRTSTKSGHQYLSAPLPIVDQGAGEEPCLAMLPQPD